MVDFGFFVYLIGLPHLLLCFDLLYSFIKYFDNYEDQQQGYNDEQDEKEFCLVISN